MASPCPWSKRYVRYYLDDLRSGLSAPAVDPIVHITFISVEETKAALATKGYAKAANAPTARTCSDVNVPIQCALSRDLCHFCEGRVDQAVPRRSEAFCGRAGLHEMRNDSI